jgi:hypothetical protein
MDGDGWYVRYMVDEAHGRPCGDVRNNVVITGTKTAR